MNKRIKTLWQQKAGIPEKYYKEAIFKREDLRIILKNEIMKIPYYELKNRVVGKSEEPIKDKYGREDYHLVYFNWKPMTKDEKMEDFVKSIL